MTPTKVDGPIRVVVADDSAFMRRLISETLAERKIKVVAAVANGKDAIAACKRYEPDVLSLDLAMPELDGIGVLKSLQKSSPTRVVVVSSFDETQGARAVDALAEGAFDLVPKVNGNGSLEEFTTSLVDKMVLAAATKRDAPARRRRSLLGGGLKRRPGAAASGRAIVIATSTGGPRALSQVIPQLPARLGAGTLIIQHMPAGFTRSLAGRLDISSQLSVVEAASGDALSPDKVLIAPGGLHLKLSDGKVQLDDGPAVGGLRPCADITIADVVAEYGSDTLLVVLTGMGRDGSKGALAVREAGGIVIAEEDTTCTVYGMPRSVIEYGLADKIVPLDKMADAIVKEVRR